MNSVKNLQLHKRDVWMKEGRDFAKRNISLLSIFLIILAMSTFFSIMTTSFLTSNNWTNIVIQIAPNIIVAVVMTFVITTGGIDLSVGSILALASALTAVLLSSGVGSVITLLLVLLAGIIVGAINGIAIAKFSIPPLIATLASMIYIRGLALFITGGYSIAILSNNSISSLGQGGIAGIPISVIIAILVVIVGFIVLKSTKFGNYVTGIGINEEAVRRTGINTNKVKLFTYMLSGAAASLAGVIIATRLGSGSSNVGNMFELDIIAAVVLGGTALFGGAGTIIGSILGVILIGIIGNGLTLLHVSPYVIQITEGLVLLFAVILNVKVFGRKTNK